MDGPMEEMIDGYKSGETRDGSERQHDSDVTKNGGQRVSFYRKRLVVNWKADGDDDNKDDDVNAGSDDDLVMMMLVMMRRWRLIIIKY